MFLSSWLQNRPFLAQFSSSVLNVVTWQTEEEKVINIYAAFNTIAQGQASSDRETNSVITGYFGFVIKL